MRFLLFYDALRVRICHLCGLIINLKIQADANTPQFGLQSYFGGQATVIILNSIFPSFLRMRNTLPERYKTWSEFGHTR